MVNEVAGFIFVDVESDVPQGSVLGPILFIFYLLEVLFVTLFSSIR